MGLFTKDKKEVELPQLDPVTTPPPPLPISRREVQDRAMRVSRELTQLLDDYRRLINGGDNLKLNEMREVMGEFKMIGRDFEKVFEIMRFDLEKHEAIDKYNQQAFQKRKELIKALEDEDAPKPPENLEEPPKPPKKGR